ncbi:hypothetical protein LSH36_120g10051 [Paralvinella palmiformis]|uniref:Uncharacterized protein n=1 Tax=Paralvinella palmiformis TaxID=53620 RepID=A0AAD9NAM4_9ANNE|nr:hypothetical protein LSH36_120g10051 [Paralvinella palmiformis]
MANLALEMINTVFEAEAEPGLTITFSLRIGINSGTYSVSPSIWLIYSVNADIVEVEVHRKWLGTKILLYIPQAQLWLVPQHHPHIC